jgi:hypothetical protein
MPMYPSWLQSRQTPRTASKPEKVRPVPSTTAAGVPRRLPRVAEFALGPPSIVSTTLKYTRSVAPPGPLVNMNPLSRSRLVSGSRLP